MRQIKKPVKRRRKHCPACGKLFYPDPRTKGKQKYCSESQCQRIRQRKNEADWRKRNPDSLSDQYEQSKKWHKAHPDYSRKRRDKVPGLSEKNRKDTKIRMRKIRGKEVFDKSKSIITQLVGIKGKNCYLTQGKTWLVLRLTKASLLFKSGSLLDNCRNFKYASDRIDFGRLYDLSGIF